MLTSCSSLASRAARLLGGHGWQALPCVLAQQQRPFSLAGGSRQDGMLPRIYKDVDVAKHSGSQGWIVTLDGRTLKTPGREDLAVPTKALAMAIAAEWEYQESRAIRPFTMPLMSLAATAIDQPKPAPMVIDTLLSFLATDTLCLREEGHEGLSQKQEELYAPVMKFYNEEFKAEVQTTTAIFGAQQPEATVERIREYLKGLDKWHLAAVDSLSASCRSLLTGVACMHGVLGPEEALKVARLEEDFQMEEWGLVEGGHDIDAADYAVRVTAPLVFAQLLKS